MSGASLEVFGPFSVHRPRSRPQLSGGAILLDDPASTFRHQPARAARPAGMTGSLRVFALDGHVAMKLVWRTCGPGFGSESDAHVCFPSAAGASTRCRDFIGTWRRVDGLLPVAPYVFDRWSSGVTGETGRLGDRQPCEPARSEATHALRACHARQRSDHSSAFATRPPGRIHESFARSRPSSAWRSATRATAA